MAPQPDDEAVHGRLLHVNYVAGDPAARGEIFLRYYEALKTHLQIYIKRKQLFLRAGDIDALVDEAAIDALESYVNRPASYDPAKRSLGGYLRMAAEGDFKNRLTREVGREAGSESGFVRLEDDAWNNIADEGIDSLDAIEDEHAAAALLSLAGDVVETDTERTVLRLMLERERGTTVYAMALGLTARSPREQRAEVNRIKDRLTKRLKRRFSGGSSDGSDGPGQD